MTTYAPIRITSPRVADAMEGFTRARWWYIDREHQHEVHAGIRHTSGPEWVVKESAYDNGDPGETFETISPLREAWEAKMHHMELEARLASLGAYARHDLDDPRWVPLPAPTVGATPDLRPVGVHIVPGNAMFHHFHNPLAGDDRVIIIVPHGPAEHLRHLIARAEGPFGDAQRARITLLHPRLPTVVARSVIAREQREAETRGMRKHVTAHQFAATYGARWRADILTAYSAMLTRVGEGRLGIGRKDEGGGAPPDALYVDYARALSDPKLAALTARFLAPEEEAGLIAAGEPTIRQAFARKRAAAPLEDKHHLAIVEAALLARDGLRDGIHRVDPEVAALVRRFSFYL